MIGRGTRIRPDLFGKGKDKECFYIFDYLGNFEYFRENKNGIEGSANVSTLANIFGKRIKLISHMQDASFAIDEYQNLRDSMISEVHKQITGLSLDRIDVKLKRKYVDKFHSKEAFNYLSEQDKSDLITHIASLVTTDETDDKALEFDNMMYGLILSQLEGCKMLTRFKNATVFKASTLLKKTTIPQVKAKIPLLKHVTEDEFWVNADILNFENTRLELRDLMKFAVGEAPKTVYTNFEDTEVVRIVGKEFELTYDFEDYKLKVNKYIEENKNNVAIHKLRNNIPLTESDYNKLEKIFTGELGSKEDYETNFKDTPFGLLVRKVAKMERQAALKAFSSFINEENLNANQIAFVNKIIDYIEQNGYLENVAELTKPPFDKPQSFIRLFDPAKQKKLVHIINQVKDNATQTIS
jgi:type I restriction enzyme, R subunit